MMGLSACIARTLFKSLTVSHLLHGGRKVHLHQARPLGRKKCMGVGAAEVQERVKTGQEGAAFLQFSLNTMKMIMQTQIVVRG
jgi:hypothetical protein